MEVAGTRAAFQALISQKGFARKFGYDKGIVSIWKKGTRPVTLDKMEEVLTACGAMVIQEKVWAIQEENQTGN